MIGSPGLRRETTRILLRVTFKMVRCRHSGLAEGHDFWAAKDKRIAHEAIRQIRAELRRMALHSGLGRPVDEPAGRRREWIIRFGKAGFVVQYVIQGKDIIILRLKHQRRKPFEPR